MAERVGRPFTTPPDDGVEELAAIAAAVQTMIAAESASARPNGAAQAPGRHWKVRARTEGLR